MINETDHWENMIRDIPKIKGLWVLIEPCCPLNAGHVLGDEVFAVWQALCVFGLQNESVNIITSNCFKHKQLYKCLTNNKLFSRNDFKKEVSFEKLIVGMSRNGYARGHQLGPYIFPNWRTLSSRASYLPQFKEVFESFRQHSYKLVGIDEASVTFQQNKRSILFLDKCKFNSEHKTLLHDIDTLIELTRKQHNTHNVKKIKWAGMDISEQIKEMAIADVVVSLPGADLMNCIFLNPKSTIICPSRFVVTGTTLENKTRGTDYHKEGSNEIEIWFQFTHKYVTIDDVSAIEEGNILYVKINDTDSLLSSIKNIILNKENQ